MENSADGKLSNKIKWAYSALIIIVTWFAVVLQFSLSIPEFMKHGHSLCFALVKFFSYYTILSNLLMVVCLTVILLVPRSAGGRFFSKSTVLTSMALYITVVGLVYNLVLRSQWHPVGLFRLADELLHVLNPLLFIIYWFAFVVKDGLRYRHVWPWLLYPLIYFIFVLVRGAACGDYPYPFMDVSKSGYVSVILNSLILFAFFWIVGALYILIARRLSKSNQ